MITAEAHRTETALKLWVVLSRAWSAVAEHARADLERHGLTPAEFAVLEVLHHKGPLLLGEIRRKVLVSSGGITYLVDKLATKGLVERRACAEDRRAMYAALTKAGTRLMEAIFPEHARAIARALEGLDPGEKRAATALLRKAGLHAEGLSPRAAPERATRE